MKVTIVGTGYVGLVSGTCFAEFGVNITCVDKDLKKINDLRNGIIPIYEPGLDELVKKNINQKRLSFETDLKKSLKNTSAVFIAVGTPSRKTDGHADLSSVFNVAKEIGKSLNSAWGGPLSFFKVLKKKRDEDELFKGMELKR